MSDAIGPVTVLPRDDQAPVVPLAESASEETQRVVDTEVRRIVEEAHDEVSGLLREHRDQLEALADALVEHETLDEIEAYAAAGIPHDADELVLERS